MNTVPLVSVWMVTFNHQDYITQTVESVMMQQTNFSFHLFIGEDCSSDETKLLCQSLKTKYPNKITLILNEKNLGPNKNAKNIYEACWKSGAKYIAMLEGDDYWTDPLKLQKQVDFMEGNPEYTGCFHNTLEIHESTPGLQPKLWRNYNKSIFTLSDTLATRSLFHTSSFLFRAKFLEIPDWFINVQSGDMALFTILASKGTLYRIDDCMSVYRKNPAGITSSIKQREYHQNRIKLFNFFETFLQGRETHKIKEVIQFHQKELNKLKSKHSLKSKLLSLFKG